MKKIFRMTCIALGAVIMLSGCGTKTNDKTADGKVKLSVGGWPTKEGPALDSMNNALKRFNEKYGNEIEITPDNWKLFSPRRRRVSSPTFTAYISPSLTELLTQAMRRTLQNR